MKSPPCLSVSALLLAVGRASVVSGFVPRRLARSKAASASPRVIVLGKHSGGLGPVAAAWPLTSQRPRDAATSPSARVAGNLLAVDGSDTSGSAPIPGPPTSLSATTATSSAADDPSPEAKKAKSPFPVVLWRFTRPHTLIGSALAIPALHLLAAPTLGGAFTVRNLIALIFAMVPSLLMNLYITGLNQITDVEIDRINKPDLPIAAGDLAPSVAVAVVLVALVLSLGMGLSNPVLGSEGLNVALWGSALLGTMYSLPPFRLKRFPLLAAFCIVAVRGTIINAGFFAHARAAAYGAARGTPAASVLGCLLNDPRCLWSSIFFGVFGIVIALMKDVPDVGGDEAHSIRSFSVQAGQGRVFKAMRRLLTGLFLAFGAGFVRGAFSAPSAFVAACRGILGAAAFAAGLSVREEARPVDPEDSEDVYRYYMHLWKLFYLSYLFLPLAR